MSDAQINDLIRKIVIELKSINSIKAIVLGGSRAINTHRPDSDIDLGLYYQTSEPIDVELIKTVAQKLNDAPNPIVTKIGEWGKWVNGGAWLTIENQRVDLLYRELNFVEQIIDENIQGKKHSDYYQQPPYGFHSYIYCAEVQTCNILLDPQNLIPPLKQKVITYPQALKKTIINGFLWDAEFTLHHAEKSAKRGDIYVTSGCVTRIGSNLVQVLYAINDMYFIGDKRIAHDIEAFGKKPENFLQRISDSQGKIGLESIELKATSANMKKLIEEVKQLSSKEYTSKY